MNRGHLACGAAECALRLPAAQRLGLPPSKSGRPGACTDPGQQRRSWSRLAATAPAPRGAREASLSARLPGRTHQSPAVLFLQLAPEPQLSPASHRGG